MLHNVNFPFVFCSLQKHFHTFDRRRTYRGGVMWLHTSDRGRLLRLRNTEDLVAVMGDQWIQFTFMCLGQGRKGNFSSFCRKSLHSLHDFRLFS